MFGKSTKTSAHPDREYFLHLGLHKTATTALQEFLFRSQSHLLAKDVRYIPLKRMRAEVTPLFCNADKGARRKLIDLLNQFPNQKVLLSDENIIGNPGDIQTGALYPYAANRVLSFCEEVAPAKVTLFLTLRDPSSFITSMYCEFIRHNSFVSFDEYTGACRLPDFSYRRTFHWLGRMPKSVTVRVIPFESALGGGVPAITARILDDLAGGAEGFDLDLFPKSKSRSSYSQEEIDLATTISNQAGPRMAQVFLNALDAKNQRFGCTRFNPMPSELVEHLQARYRSELADLM